MMMMSDHQQDNNLSWDISKFDETSNDRVSSSTDGNGTAYDEDVAYGNLPYPDFTQISAVRIGFIVLYVIVMILALSGNAMVCYTGT